MNAGTHGTILNRPRKDAARDEFRILSRSHLSPLFSSTQVTNRAAALRSVRDKPHTTGACASGSDSRSLDETGLGIEPSSTPRERPTGLQPARSPAPYTGQESSEGSRCGLCALPDYKRPDHC